ncbi:MAG TPA: hypothetical protein PK530_17625, partial [Anaerolineales bacterium]|nr:hypothetical protein [Anaerolineales bacterium]
MTLFLTVGIVKGVPAQTAEPVWSPPVNLSNSGSATAATILVVPNGPVIAVWKDEFDGFVFTRLVDGQWETPKAVDFPFADSDNAPILLVDNVGSVHAFWLDQESSLFYSSASLENFGTTNWSGTASISESVTVFTAAIDAQNDLSVMYIRSLNTADAPTGIYYRKRSAAGAAWVTPVLLYPSSYLRLLTADQITMQLQARTGSDGQTTLYAMWDNRPRGQLFLSITPDAGTTWAEPVEIRGPGTSAAAPVAIGMTLTDDDQLLFLWQEKISDTNCRQFYQPFSLTGEAVNPPQVMLSEFPVCPEGNQLIPMADGRVILQTSVFNLNYLLVWNGDTWSEPQIQSELSNFVNPDTLQSIDLKCLKTQAADNNHLFMLGCDNDLGGDMWFTSRELG